MRRFPTPDYHLNVTNPKHTQIKEIKPIKLISTYFHLLYKVWEKTRKGFVEGNFLVLYLGLTVESHTRQKVLPTDDSNILH